MSGKKYKKKSIDLAKKIAKEENNYTCEKCHRAKSQGWQMHGAHIIPVEYGRTAADPDNILCLCARCHSMGRTSAHENPLQFSRWFEKKYPNRYDKLWKIARKAGPIYENEWEEKAKALKNKLLELKGRKKKLPRIYG